MTSTAIDAIIATTLHTRFEDIDDETVQYAKDRVKDTVGCLIGGADDPSNPELVRLMVGQGGKPEATILMYGDRIPAASAAMVNCILCRSFDYEPVSPVVGDSFAPGHVSATTVMTALTLGEALGADGREIITALLLGDDLAARLLNTCEFTLAMGWDGNGTANALGATAVAGRLLGLDAKQLRNAFGLVLSQLSGTAQNIWEGTTAFKLPTGLAARNAIFSAQLATVGWTAPNDAVQGRFGYYDLFTSGIRNEELLTKDMGKKLYGERTFKPYPCCLGNHGSIDCALEIVQQLAASTQPGEGAKRLSPKSIDRVTICLPGSDLDSFLTQPWEPGDFPHANAIFSLRYTVATALLRGSVRPKHFTAEAMRDPTLREFIDKIEFAALGSGNKGVVVTVVTEDGHEYSAENQVPRGQPGNPLSREELQEKFWDNVEFAGRPERRDAESLLESLENLDALDDVNEVTRLLTP